jgi:hypothetical protein
MPAYGPVGGALEMAPLRKRLVGTSVIKLTESGPTGYNCMPAAGECGFRNLPKIDPPPGCSLGSRTGVQSSPGMGWISPCPHMRNAKNAEENLSTDPPESPRPWVHATYENRRGPCCPAPQTLARTGQPGAEVQSPREAHALVDIRKSAQVGGFPQQRSPISGWSARFVCSANTA